MREYCRASVDEILGGHGTDLQTGLLSSNIPSLQMIYGSNKFEAEEKVRFKYSFIA